MGDASSTIVYKAQCKNVSKLDSARRQIIRSINTALRRGDEDSAKVHTLTLAIIYSAWAETSFSKLVHTPHGFERFEIDQIKAASKRNVKSGWAKCLELALKRVPPAKPGEIPNKLQDLSRWIDKYIVDPSVLRNKIAHGQWASALNSEHTLINPTITNQIQDLDVVKLSILFRIFEHIQHIIEDIIESPQKTHHRDYYIHVTALEAYINASSHFTKEKRVQQLRKKTAYYKQRCNCGHPNKSSS